MLRSRLTPAIFISFCYVVASIRLLPTNECALSGRSARPRERAVCFPSTGHLCLFRLFLFYFAYKLVSDKCGLCAMLIDGEAVTCNETGLAEFESLRSRRGDSAPSISWSSTGRDLPQRGAKIHRSGILSQYSNRISTYQVIDVIDCKNGEQQCSHHHGSGMIPHPRWDLEI